MDKAWFLVCALLLGPGVRGGVTVTRQTTGAPKAAPPSVAAPAAAIPAEDAAKVNPLKATPEGLAKAKQIYGWDCAVCHGERGDGKGDLGAKYNLRDWTKAASLQGMTDGELYYTIAKGRGQMPSEGDRAKPDDVWNLVILVRSYSTKPA